MIYSCLLWVIANVNLTTTIRDIDPRSVGQRAGSITMSVDANDFFNPLSVEEPEFIRIRLDKNTSLSETLVDIKGGYGPTEPIYLAMWLKSTGNEILVAPAHTISIARWRKGEKEIWLQVNSSSTTWVEREGQVGPPDSMTQVAWKLGQALEKDESTLAPLFESGKANLPANVQSGEPVHTFILIDTENSQLLAEPRVEREQNYDTISFDHPTLGVRTEANPAAIRLGNGSATNFTGSDTIGLAGLKRTRVVPLEINSMAPGINLVNPFDDSRPVSLRLVGDQGPGRYGTFIAKPGLTRVPWPADAHGWSLLITEAESIQVEPFFVNRSGHRFAVSESGARPGYRFPVQWVDGVQTALWLHNPSDQALNIDADLVDHQGQFIELDLPELDVDRSLKLDLAPYLDGSSAQSLVLSSLAPFLACVTQTVDAGNGEGWLRDVPSAPLNAETVKR